MVRELLGQITGLDWLALAWFLGCWGGYAWFGDRRSRTRQGLIGVSHRHRLDWARQLMAREVRIVDSSLVGNLMGSVSFYANTTIYIIAGLVAVIGTLDKAILATAELPFARATGRELWELKLLLLFGIFVFAYFKFTWCMRQFNLVSMLIGAAPPPAAGEAERERAAQRLAALNALAGDEFNSGIRAYYFGLAAVSWIIQPWMFMVVTTLIVAVLYRRDFASKTLAALKD
jgi:uncharacterized membrane protein